MLLAGVTSEGKDGRMFKKEKRVLSLPLFARVDEGVLKREGVSIGDEREVLKEDRRHTCYQRDSADDYIGLCSE